MTEYPISKLDLIAIGIALILTTLVDNDALKWIIGLTAYISIRWYQVSSGQDRG
jgi:hypothetical protein